MGGEKMVLSSSICFHIVYVFSIKVVVRYYLCYNCIITYAQEMDGKEGAFPQVSTWFAPSSASGPGSDGTFRISHFKSPPHHQ